jgi:multiple sugar transport system ATP-binding protein
MIYVTHDQEEAMTLGDRILVMNAGRCAQLDTPRHIYEHPANLFVASFIGRPPMILIDVQYTVERERAFLVRDSLRLEVTPLRDKIERALGGQTNLVLGIRPEHLSFGPFSEEGWVQFSLPAVVDLVQPLARKKFLDLKIGDTLIKMVVPGTASFRQGESFPLGFPLHRIHLFHRTTEEAIL